MFSGLALNVSVQSRDRKTLPKRQNWRAPCRGGSWGGLAASAPPENVIVSLPVTLVVHASLPCRGVPCGARDRRKRTSGAQKRVSGCGTRSRGGGTGSGDAEPGLGGAEPGLGGAEPGLGVRNRVARGLRKRAARRPISHAPRVEARLGSCVVVSSRIAQTSGLPLHAWEIEPFKTAQPPKRARRRSGWEVRRVRRRAFSENPARDIRNPSAARKRNRKCTRNRLPEPRNRFTQPPSPPQPHSPPPPPRPPLQPHSPQPPAPKPPQSPKPTPTQSPPPTQPGTAAGTGPRLRLRLRHRPRHRHRNSVRKNQRAWAAAGIRAAIQSRISWMAMARPGSFSISW